MNTPKLTAIVMVDRDWAIGKDGNQLIYIPNDLKRFKKITMGNPIIYGRKTMSTFPKGKPLSGRQNLLLSSTVKEMEGVQLFRSVENLLQNSGIQHGFVVGGASVYKALFPYISDAFVTMVDAQFPADCYFPNLEKEEPWVLAQESDPMIYDGFVYRYQTYIRE